VVTVEKTGKVLFNHKLCDASELEDRYGATRALAISKNGRRIAVTLGKYGEKEKAEILAQEGAIALHTFSGSTFRLGPDTIDRRGAAFSPSESLTSSLGAHSITVDSQRHTVWISFAKNDKAYIQAFTAK
jgi:hypothetical protein